jgi:hypothetical protein
MPNYNLYCDDCDQEIEIFCSIKDYDTRMKNIICPNCCSRKIYRNYQEDNIYSSIKEITTVGQLAEKNTKKMGSKIDEEYHKNKREESKQWYQSPKYGEASRSEINKMTREQKKNYILKGKK